MAVLSALVVRVPERVRAAPTTALVRTPVRDDDLGGLPPDPKGTDLGVHSSDDLDWVVQELNNRPRKRLAFKKPIELIGDLLLR